jgi:hypothetical protein
MFFGNGSREVGWMLPICGGVLEEARELCVLRDGVRMCSSAFTGNSPGSCRQPRCA